MIKKSQIRKLVSNEFAKKYDCPAYARSNFSFKYTIIYPLLFGPDYIQDSGYFVKVKHSLFNREIVAGITFENGSPDGRQKVCVTLVNSKDAPIIKDIQESCGKGLDIIVQK